jgi:RNA polymerase sigma-70 factor (ECF subfamily)
MHGGPELSKEAIDRVADRLVVIAALGALRTADREVLCLVAWDGLDNKEAAEVLGCSPKTFAVRLHRARTRLEKALDVRDSASTDGPTSLGENHRVDRDGVRNQMKR